MQIIPASAPVSTVHPEADVVEERIAALEARSDSAREELRELLAMRGENWSDDEGYARLVPESTRVAYESKALDDLIIREPLHYGWLKDYRKQTTIRSSVQVK